VLAGVISDGEEDVTVVVTDARDAERDARPDLPTKLPGNRVSIARIEWPSARLVNVGEGLDWVLL
jgi:hypothetical protein